MTRLIIKNIIKLFVPDQTVLLGRWNLKHSNINCEKYMKNYYGDPGYPNDKKIVWIKNDITSKYLKNTI